MPQSQAKIQRSRLRVVGVAAADREAAPPPSDDELIDALARGDRDVADLLYDRLSDAVDRTLIRVLGKRDLDHDDLVQTAFEQILLTLARGRFARACSLKSWAISITTNLALGAIRRRRSERRYVDKNQDCEQLQVSSQAADPERAAELSALREQLGEIHPLTAQVVLLHEVMGFALAEVAVLTGLSIAAAQSRLVRGREELRRRLDQCRPGVLS